MVMFKKKLTIIERNSTSSVKRYVVTNATLYFLVDFFVDNNSLSTNIFTSVLTAAQEIKARHLEWHVTHQCKWIANMSVK